MPLTLLLALKRHLESCGLDDTNRAPFYSHVMRAGEAAWGRRGLDEPSRCSGQLSGGERRPLIYSRVMMAREAVVLPQASSAR